MTNNDINIGFLNENLNIHWFTNIIYLTGESDILELKKKQQYKCNNGF